MLTTIVVLLLLALVAAVVGPSRRPARRRLRGRAGVEPTADGTSFLQAAWVREVAAARHRIDAASTSLVAERSPVAAIDVDGNSARLRFADGTVLVLHCRSTAGVRVLADELAAGAPVRLGALHLTATPTAGIARFDRSSGSTAVAFDGAAALVTHDETSGPRR